MPKAAEGPVSQKHPWLQKGMRLNNDRYKAVLEALGPGPFTQYGIYPVAYGEVKVYDDCDSFKLFKRVVFQVENHRNSNSGEVPNLDLLMRRDQANVYIQNWESPHKIVNTVTNYQTLHSHRTRSSSSSPTQTFYGKVLQNSIKRSKLGFKQSKALLAVPNTDNGQRDTEILMWTLKEGKTGYQLQGALGGGYELLEPSNQTAFTCIMDSGGLPTLPSNNINKNLGKKVDGSK